jgi:hypothetical protein
MSDVKDARSVKIYFNNGDVRNYAYETLGGDLSTLGTRMNEILSASQIVLVHDDKLEIIPFVSIRSIEISPAPEMKLPHAIKVLHQFD